MAQYKSPNSKWMDFRNCFWRIDKTDIRKIIECLNVDGYQTIIETDDAEFDGIDDLTNNSDKSITSLTITCKQEYREIIQIKVYNDTLSRRWMKYGELPNQWDMIEKITDNAIAISSNLYLILWIASIFVSFGISVAIISATKIFKNDISAILLLCLSVLIPLFAADWVKKYYCKIILIEKNQKKTHWELWLEKLVFMIIGAIIAIITQKIIVTMK